MFIRWLFVVLSTGFLFSSGCTTDEDAESGMDSDSDSDGDGDGDADGDTDADSEYTEPSQICETPEMWPLPGTEKVVGSGTADSCNEAMLREAVSGGGWIRFDCGEEQAVITVTSEIQINQETVIDGKDTVTLDGGGSSRIFFVSSALSVRNLHFINGNALGEEESGGAVSGGWRSRVEVVNCVFENNVAGNAGGAVAVGTGSELTVVSSVFTHNSSRYGGAIYSLWSPLHIVNSSFIENTTAVNAGGGAIGTDGALDPDYREDGAVGGTIEICGSTFRNNAAYGAGGAAFLWVYPPDVIIIDRCTVEGNTLLKDGDGEGLAMGGGMRVSNGEIIIRNSSFISNSAQTHGGGLSLDCEPTCTITNTTIYDNEVTDGFGGAVFGDKIRMNNVTIANNFASAHGGALFGGEDLEIRNSVFADNQAGNPWGQAYSCFSTGTGDAVLQWVSDFEDSGSDVCIPDVISEDPMLEPPADNGGPTFTMLPNIDSPVLQAGHDCEAFDQRGEPRDSSSCDLGAVELP